MLPNVPKEMKIKMSDFGLEYSDENDKFKLIGIENGSNTYLILTTKSGFRAFKLADVVRDNNVYMLEIDGFDIKLDMLKPFKIIRDTYYSLEGEVLKLWDAEYWFKKEVIDGVDWTVLTYKPPEDKDDKIFKLGYIENGMKVTKLGTGSVQIEGIALRPGEYEVVDFETKNKVNIRLLESVMSDSFKEPTTVKFAFNHYLFKDEEDPEIQEKYTIGSNVSLWWDPVAGGVRYKGNVDPKQINGYHTTNDLENGVVSAVSAGLKGKWHLDGNVIEFKTLKCDEISPLYGMKPQLPNTSVFLT